MIPQPFGKYLLLERIGAGGMAEVFRATTQGVGGFEKELAIKRILPHHTADSEFVSMFIDEAKIAVALNHANIAQIYELGYLEGSYFIAMEYVHGRNLGAVLKDGVLKGRPLPIPMAVFIAMEVASGLYAAHTAADASGRPLGIIHRDISPQNVQIGYNGAVKIIDFGVAKARSKLVRTSAGTIRGKLVYMSPEQLRAQPIDDRADIFSLGLVIYKMLVGKNPFEASSELEVVAKLKRCHIDPPGTLNDRIPLELERVVLKALERRPDDRYRDAYALHQELRQVLRAIAPDVTSHQLADHIHTLYREELAERLAAVRAQEQTTPVPSLVQQATPPLQGGRPSPPRLLSDGPTFPAPGHPSLSTVKVPEYRPAAADELDATLRDPGAPPAGQAPSGKEDLAATFDLQQGVPTTVAELVAAGGCALSGVPTVPDGPKVSAVIGAPTHRHRSRSLRTMLHGSFRHPLLLSAIVLASLVTGLLIYLLVHSLTKEPPPTFTPRPVGNAAAPAREHGGRAQAPTGLPRGRLVVSTTPPGATVLVSAVPRGTSPLELTRLPQGQVLPVTVQLAGYPPQTKEIRLGEEIGRLDFALRRPSDAPSAPGD